MSHGSPKLCSVTTMHSVLVACNHSLMYVDMMKTSVRPYPALEQNSALDVYWFVYEAPIWGGTLIELHGTVSCHILV
jgi:hypothetical protein